MSERYLIRDIYDVETDASDWPAGLSDEEKAALTEIVLGVLRDCVPPHTGDLYRRVRDKARSECGRCPVFSCAVGLDWLYGCVVRAARAANCEQRWHPPKAPVVTSRVPHAASGKRRR